MTRLEEVRAIMALAMLTVILRAEGRAQQLTLFYPEPFTRPSDVIRAKGDAVRAALAAATLRG